MTIGVSLRLLFVMALWASCFPLITVGIRFAPHLAFASMRAILAGIILLALGFALRRPMPRGRRNWALIGVSGVGATSLGFLGMFHGAEFVSPVSRPRSSTLNRYLQPFWRGHSYKKGCL